MTAEGKIRGVTNKTKKNPYLCFVHALHPFITAVRLEILACIHSAACRKAKCFNFGFLTLYYEKIVIISV